MPRYRETVAVPAYKDVRITYDEDAGLFKANDYAATASLKTLKAAIDRKQKEIFKRIPCLIVVSGKTYEGQVTSAKGLNSNYGAQCRVSYEGRNGRAENVSVYLDSRSKELFTDNPKNRAILAELEILEIAYSDLGKEIEALRKTMEVLEIKESKKTNE